MLETPQKVYTCGACQHKFNQGQVRTKLLHKETRSDPPEYLEMCPNCLVELPDFVLFDYEIPEEWFQGWRHSRLQNLFYIEDYAVKASQHEDFDAIYTAEGLLNSYIIGSGPTIKEAKRLCWLHKNDLI